MTFLAHAPSRGPIDFSSAARWYDDNASAFSENSRALDTTELRATFLSGLPRQARVLDAGCGAGRDLHAFLKRGLRAEGFDASLSMVEEARAQLPMRARIRHMAFQDYRDAPGSWDGIWAMASLIHVPEADMVDTLRRLLVSLTDSGRLYVCFKHGHGQAVDPHGRPMTFLTSDALEAVLEAARPDAGRFDIWETNAPGSHGATQTWVNAIYTKAGAPA